MSVAGVNTGVRAPGEPASFSWDDAGIAAGTRVRIIRRRRPGQSKDPLHDDPYAMTGTVEGVYRHFAVITTDRGYRVTVAPSDITSGQARIEVLAGKEESKIMETAPEVNAPEVLAEIDQAPEVVGTAPAKPRGGNQPGWKNRRPDGKTQLDRARDAHECAEYQEMRNAGLSNTKIAKEWGIHEATLMTLRKEWGLPVISYTSRGDHSPPEAEPPGAPIPVPAADDEHPAPCDALPTPLRQKVVSRGPDEPPILLGPPGGIHMGPEPVFGFTPADDEPIGLVPTEKAEEELPTGDGFTVAAAIGPVSAETAKKAAEVYRRVREVGGGHTVASMAGNSVAAEEVWSRPKSNIEAEAEQEGAACPIWPGSPEALRDLVEAMLADHMVPFREEIQTLRHRVELVEAGQHDIAEQQAELEVDIGRVRSELYGHGSNAVAHIGDETLGPIHADMEAMDKRIAEKCTVEWGLEVTKRMEDLRQTFEQIKDQVAAVADVEKFEKRLAEVEGQIDDIWAEFGPVADEFDAHRHQIHGAWTSKPEV